MSSSSDTLALSLSVLDYFPILKGRFELPSEGLSDSDATSSELSLLLLALGSLFLRLTKLLKETLVSPAANYSLKYSVTPYAIRRSMRA